MKTNYIKFIQENETLCKNFENAVNEKRLYGIERYGSGARHYIDIMITHIDKTNGFIPFWYSIFCANVGGYRLDKDGRIIASGGNMDVVRQIIETVCRRLNDCGYHCNFQDINKYSI